MVLTSTQVHSRLSRMIQDKPGKVGPQSELLKPAEVMMRGPPQGQSPENVCAATDAVCGWCSQGPMIDCFLAGLLLPSLQY